MRKKINKIGLLTSGLAGVLILLLSLPSKSNAIEPKPRPAYIFSVKVHCTPPWGDTCVQIFGIKLFDGKLDRVEWGVDFKAGEMDECPQFISDGHIWIPEESWGATHLNICYDEQPEVVVIKAVGTENTEEFNDYDQWKAAAESATGQ